MKNIFISHSFKDKNALRTVNFLNTNLSLNNYELADIDKHLNYEKNCNELSAKAIDKCSVFVCFIDSQNSNVMFQLGYALGRSKKIILIADPFDIPSDIQGMELIRKDTSPYEIISIIEKELIKIKSRPSFEDEPKLLLDYLHRLRDPYFSDRIEYKIFENIISNWFKYKGFTVLQAQGYMRDFYDFKVIPLDEEDKSIIVEVKKYNATSKLPISTIRDIEEVVNREGAQGGIIVSNVKLTKSTWYYLRDSKILILNIFDLIELLKSPNNHILGRINELMHKNFAREMNKI